ncbi:MAG: ATP-dependent DNA helicase RecG [Planctomycetota bacterium]|jgi:ATP-dependent DNA helicase RecG
MTELNDSVQFIKGVGPARAADFSKLDINTVKDLLFTFPRKTSDRSNIITIKEAGNCLGTDVVLKVTAIDSKTRKFSRKSITTVLFSDDTGEIEGVWFNTGWIEDKFDGSEVILYGKIGYKNGHLQIVHPKIETIDDDSENLSVGRIVPVYPLTGSLTQTAWLKIMKNVLDNYLYLLKDFYPDSFLDQRRMMSLQDAVKNMHFPENTKKEKIARQRLVYDECLLLQLGILFRRHKDIDNTIGRSFRFNKTIDQRTRAVLPFKLTKAQDEAVYEILDDMQTKRPMHRLLQGDVGSGKTAVAFFVSLCAVANKSQVALMVPTELLARQHEQTFKSFLKRSHKSKVKISLLVGGMKKSERAAKLSSISSGGVDIIIGTHAAIQKDVTFKNLGLIIIDEQHKFGVAQRAMLKSKGHQSDVLVMTATPIPRSLALTIYGDLDISTIQGALPGRKRVRTIVPSPEKWASVWNFLRKEFRNGRQAYIVAPLVEENENLDLNSATESFKKLKNGEFSSFNLELIHGQMKKEKQQKIMAEFRSGKIDALVSTVVIEVGVDVPNATILVVLHAERFGLSQLHQLRGRVTRGTHQGYCILISNSKTDEARKRLEILVKEFDGFIIAEEDLKLRGAGEFLGTRQHGKGLQLTSLLDDFDILKAARDDARKILNADPCLTADSHRQIKEELFSQHGNNLNIAGTG